MGTLEREEKSNNYDVNNDTFYIKCRIFFHELYEIYKVNTHAVSKASLIQIMRLNAAFLYEIIPNKEISKCILFSGIAYTTVTIVKISAKNIGKGN